MPLLDLPNGYYQLPAGRMANVVTCFEMRAKPSRPLKRLPEGASLVRFAPDDLAAFRSVFRAVGENFLWFSRLIMSDKSLAGILADPAVVSSVLRLGGLEAGLLELDFREPDQCELSFFGLVPGAIGTGLGRALMDEAIAMAWARPIARFWVHTCTFDAPEAVPFYLRSGFTAYARMVEIHDDPRLQGKLAVTASPQVPLIR